MSSKNKTQETNASVKDFIESFVADEQKRADSIQLIELMSAWSGYPPKMWGPSIIGFGAYHYKYASGHEGDAAIIGFSPRKTAISLYVWAPWLGQENLLNRLGKYKMGKACIYIKKLSDIDLEVLKQLCNASMQYVTEHHTIGSGM